MKCGFVCLIYVLAAASLTASGLDGRYPVPIGDANVTLKGFVGRKAEAFLDRRIYSEEAQGDIFDETEHAFETHYDSIDSKGVGRWQGEYWGKSMLGFTGAYRMDRKPELRDFIVGKCRRLVERFQRADGAITTYADVRQVRKGWNLWGRKYTLWGLLEAYDATGEKFMLDACVNLVDQQIAMLDEMGIELYETGMFMGMPSCSVLNPLLILYERTGEKRFLDYARRIVQTWEKSGNGNPGLVVNALGDRPVHEWFPHPESWAKTYEMMSCYEGMAAYSRITGEKRPFDAVRAFASKLLDRELNALWSVGYYDHFEESAAYASATSEICDIIYWNRLLGELYRGTGDDRWLDLFERSFINAFLAGVYHREGWASHGVRSHGHSHQTCVHEVKMLYHSCCVDNAPRGFFGYAEHSAAIAADGTVFLNFYTDAEIRAGDVKLSVSGGYPIGEKVRIDAVAQRPVKVRLRRPEGCDGMKASVPSVWRDGRLEMELPAGKTSFSLDIPMPPRIVDTQLVGSGVPDKGHVRFMFELRGGEMAGMLREKPAARVMRGPLLLCKAKIAGVRDRDIFDRCTVNGETGWRVSVVPLEPSATWGLWRLTIEKAGEKRTWTVCDYASAADRDFPRNSFSIWF